MSKEIKRRISSHFSKMGLDEIQVDALPPDIRRNLIHGTREEFKKAMAEIKEKNIPLGDAGMELIKDLRGWLEYIGNKEKKSLIPSKSVIN